MKYVRNGWSVIKLPNGAAQDDDNHAGRDLMNLSPVAVCLLAKTTEITKSKKKAADHWD